MIGHLYWMYASLTFAQKFSFWSVVYALGVIAFWFVLFIGAGEDEWNEGAERKAAWMRGEDPNESVSPLRQYGSRMIVHYPRKKRNPRAPLP